MYCTNIFYRCYKSLSNRNIRKTFRLYSTHIICEHILLVLCSRFTLFMDIILVPSMVWGLPPNLLKHGELILEDRVISRVKYQWSILLSLPNSNALINTILVISLKSFLAATMQTCSIHLFVQMWQITTTMKTCLKFQKMSHVVVWFLMW